MLPDAALEAGPWNDEAHWWLSGTDAGDSSHLEVPGLGSFVRALLPVHLEGPGMLTYGVWVSVSAADLHRSLDLWNEDSYPDLVLDAHLANAVPQGRLGAPVRLIVRDPEHAPYCDTSADPDLHSLLTGVWRAVDGAPTTRVDV